MPSIVERFRRGAQQMPVAPEEDLAPHVEQREKTYPNTIKDVLMRLSDISLTADLDTLQEEAELAHAALSQIARDGVANFRRSAEQSGRAWEGKLTFGGFPRGQDGHFWDHSEGVEIKGNTSALPR